MGANPAGSSSRQLVVMMEKWRSVDCMAEAVCFHTCAAAAAAQVGIMHLMLCSPTKS